VIAGRAPASRAVEAGTVLAELTGGRVRAAEPNESSPDGWRVRPEVKAAILACFTDPTTTTWQAGPFLFRDRAALRPIDPGPGRRVVPGGSAIRIGAHLEPGVVRMPPSYVNVGAWIGADTMIDSHVLVGSCAQIGADVHLGAGVTIGGVLEPPGARPVIVEDGVFVGAGSRLLDGVLVRRGAVIGAGVVLTGTSRLYDLVDERELRGTIEMPLVVPPASVVVPGSRVLSGAWAEERGLSLATALIVKRRDAGTSARVALEETLR
jgi:2,3,4,5-tetrahydropyridine-2-carboxylate N-succinyltransferase